MMVVLSPFKPWVGPSQAFCLRGAVLSYSLLPQGAHQERTQELCKLRGRISLGRTANRRKSRKPQPACLCCSGSLGRFHIWATLGPAFLSLLQPPNSLALSSSGAGDFCFLVQSCCGSSTVQWLSLPFLQVWPFLVLHPGCD